MSNPFVLARARALEEIGEIDGVPTRSAQASLARGDRALVAVRPRGSSGFSFVEVTVAERSGDRYRSEPASSDEFGDVESFWFRPDNVAAVLSSRVPKVAIGMALLAAGIAGWWYWSRKNAASQSSSSQQSSQGSSNTLPAEEGSNPGVKPDSSNPATPATDEEGGGGKPKPSSGELADFGGSFRYYGAVY